MPPRLLVEMVQSAIVTDPALTRASTPTPPEPYGSEALSVTLQSCSDMLPDPRKTPEPLAPVSRSPLTETFVVAGTAIDSTVPVREAFTVRSAAPGPTIVAGLINCGSGADKPIVCGPAEKSVAPLTLVLLKTMVSALGASKFACVSTSTSEPGP